MFSDSMKRAPMNCVPSFIRSSARSHLQIPDYVHDRILNTHFKDLITSHYPAARLRTRVLNSNSSSTESSFSRFQPYTQRSGGQSTSRSVRIVARSRDR